MQRTILPSHNDHPNFIGAWMIEPPSLCDALITHFEENKSQQKKGISGRKVSLDTKNSIDITISPKELNQAGNQVFKTYFESLFDCYQDYVTQWPFLEAFREELHVGRFNLQRYQAGQHFQKIHTERASLGTLHRLFAWMTYLNDVDTDDGGTTFFSHYGLEIQPKKGLTLIWPAEWTHAHKGNVLRNNSKYIITGWMHFPS
jgi:prolyl 4-hydroxylase